MSIGQRMDARRYFYHPPTGWTEDGRPLDSGTAHVIHSNLSHLSEQNMRLIGHTPGPGYLPPNDTGDKLWEGIVDAARLSTASLGTYDRRPWVQPLNAIRFGPFAAVARDLSVDPPGYRPRKFRVMVDGTHNSSSATDLSVVAALTDTPAAPPHSGGVLDIQEDRFNTISVDFRADITLDPRNPVRPSETWRCRDAAAGLGTSHLAVAELWVWVYWDSMFGGDAIWSISVFEVTDV